MRKFKRQLNRMSRSPQFNPGAAERRVLASIAMIFAIAVLGVAAFNIANITAEADRVCITRGVISEINELPDTKLDGTTADVGTEENPFVILEIVPYEEYAEIGYLISGCEPVDLTAITYDQMKMILWVSGIDSAICFSTDANYYFADEPEYSTISSDGSDKYGYGFTCNPSNTTSYNTGQYSSSNTSSYKGYYEVVEAGTGTFYINEYGGISKATTSNQQAVANIIWHTLTGAEKTLYSSTSFTQSMPDMTEVGSRWYTTRSASGEAIKVYWECISYYSLDSFLYDTIGLETAEDVANYSIVVKTITPSELNANPEWIQYANLISIHDSCGYNSTYTVSLYKSVYGTNGAGTGEEVLFEGDFDLSWEVAIALYQKITASEDYAALMIPNLTYVNLGKKGTQTKWITTYDVDWNLNLTSNHHSTTGSTANLYKLMIMLYSMDSDLFKSLFLNEDNPLINSEGQYILQSGDAQNYWTMYSFMLTDADGNSLDWTTIWDTYQIVGSMDSDLTYIYGHVYAYGYTSCFYSFSKSSNTVDNASGTVKYTDFATYLEENGLDYGIASALAYALGIGSTSSTKLNLGTFSVLDIEPVYGSDGLEEDENAGWSLKESYIRLMIPNLSASTTIEITHMTTAEFIGRSEDLNSTYDLIYIGDQIDGFNTKTGSITYNTISGSTTTDWSATITDFNDDTMDGLIYFHTGDYMYVYSRTYRDTDFVNSSSSGLAINGTGTKYTTALQDSYVRFSGNDITSIKLEELKEFLEAGLPIVTTTYLYTLSTSILDQSSNLYTLISDAKKSNATIYRVADTTSIAAAVEASSPTVEFTTIPEIYDGSTDEDGNIDIENANYLPKNKSGQSVMSFAFTITDSKENTYAYDIYVDQNQDGKFSDDEVYLSVAKVSTTGGSASVSKSFNLSSLYMGVVNWEIVVYQVDNPSVRFVKKGISAAEASDEAIELLGGEKTKISVLQIIPDGITDSTKVLDLSNCELFDKYTENLQDYEIIITTITNLEFEEYFKNYATDADGNYIYDSNGEAVISGANFTCSDYTNTDSATMSKSIRTQIYEAYDMIIFGFADCYGSQDISNDYGAVDFLYYWIAMGKGILFTHDMCSLNTTSGYFGYNVATLLRDAMGMNRYGVIYNSLDSASKSKLIAYQSANSSIYDKLTRADGSILSDIQGLSYEAIKLMACIDWSKPLTTMPFRYMITNSLGDFVASWGGTTGVNSGTDTTTKVTNVNTGEITSYPYKISTTLTVAETHAQYYQLNLEDPEVTVWYCLANDCLTSSTSTYGGTGSGVVYGASPNDVSNNYYIYSKGNVFYSGVGHSGASITDDEMKLFINTMIAAYRTSYQAPVVEINNSEATVVSADDTTNVSYSIQAYMEMNEETNTVSILPDATTQTVYFTPSELNVATTEITLNAYYLNIDTDESGSTVVSIEYIDVIYDTDTGKALTPTASTDQSVVVTYMDAESGDEISVTVNTTVYTFDVTQNHEYYLIYPLAKMESTDTADAQTTIQFRVKNDKCEDYGYTTLTFEEQILMMLD